MEHKTFNTFAAFDIGADSIKLSLIEAQDKKLSLLKLLEEPLEPVGNFSLESEYKNHKIKALTKLVSNLTENKAVKFACVISHRDIQVKILSLSSQIKLQQLEKILAWEAKKLLPSNFQKDPFAFSYKIIQENPFKIILSVIPDKVLQENLELYNNAGIKINSAFSEVFVAQSLFDSIDTSNFNTVSIASIGSAESHLHIFHSGEMKFYRFIPSGVLQTHATPQEADLEAFSQKIKFSFDYFRAIEKITHMDAIYFIGKGTSKQSFIEFKKSYFSPTKIAPFNFDLVLETKTLLDQIAPSPDEQADLISLFLPSIGTNLTFFADQSDSMDYLSSANYKVGKKIKKKKYKINPMWLYMILLIVLPVLIWALKADADNRIEALTLEIAAKTMDLNAINTKIQDLPPILELNEIELELVKSSLSAMPLNNMLLKLSTSIPKGVAVEKILVSDTEEAEKAILVENETYDSNNSDPIEFHYAELDKDNFSESIKGDVLIIKGFAKSNIALSTFVESLVEKKVIDRILYLASKQYQNGNKLFLIKGNIP